MRDARIPALQFTHSAALSVLRASALNQCLRITQRMNQKFSRVPGDFPDLFMRPAASRHIAALFVFHDSKKDRRSVHLNEGFAGLDFESFRKPTRDSGRKMGINPDGHAVRTGWSMRRRANWMQARMSSRSRSGNSSRISACERPASNRSSTSDTRIRIPRMHGRPPHSFGFEVIRSKMAIWQVSV